MKNDNLKVIVVAKQMPISLSDGARRTTLSDSSFVSGLPNLKIWDDKLHAHTVA